MASVTIYPTSNGSIAHSVVGGSTAYGCLADNSDDTYIRYVATKNEEVKTSTFNVGASNSISGRFVITGITVVSRTKKGYSSMDTASAHSNLYVGGIEGSSWSLSVGSSWANQSHTSSVSEFSNLNGKALTSLPSLVLHLQSTTKVKTTGDNKWVGFSRAYITLTYDTLYSQSAQGGTGVSASVSNSGSAVQGYYKSGTTTTYTATLSDGYGFAGWYTASSGGTLVSRELTYSETCSSDRTLYARAFAVSVQGETGVTASVSRGSDGYTFTFTATMSSTQSYGFKGWYDNSSGTGTPVSTSLSYSVALSSATTYYAKVFTVSVSGSTGVSASLSRGSDYKTFTFTATLSNDYAIDGWYDGSTRKSRSMSYSATLSGDTSYTAKAFSVSYSGDSGISVSASRGSNGYTYTFTAEFSDTTKIKSTLNKWTLDGTDQSWTNLSNSVDVGQNTTVSVSSYRTTLDDSSLQGATATIARSSNTSVTLGITTQNGWDFDGWYVSGNKVSDAATYTLTPSASSTVIPNTARHVYSVNAYGDAHCTTSVTADNYYLGTTITVTATVTDSGYKFKGWYNDSSYTSPYASTASVSIVIDGDITLYAKSVLLDRFYLKINGEWQQVAKVYQKVSGSWVEVSEPNYVNLFDVNKKYIKHNIEETWILITNDGKQFITADNRIFNVNH